MSDYIKLKFTIESTDTSCPLSFEVFWNGETRAHCFHIREIEHVEIELLDTEQAEHELCIVMSGKLPDHTQLDGQGNIIKDALLKISGVSIDDFDISSLLYEVAEYSHDFNGTGKPTRMPFHGSMGCNGTVSFKFSTPYYLWLLENM